jgi:Ca-activated chloride channel family protein
MTFVWPELLWFLLAIPLLVGVYLLLLRRRKKEALRYAGLTLVKEAMGPPQRLRRHLPPLLFLLALIALLLAVARPAAVITLPSQHKIIILALDVSGSMRATDVSPNRLAAAQAAVRSFVEQVPSQTQLGVVAFAGTASMVQAPTRNREDVLAAVNRMQLQRGTAVGSGLLVSLKAIFPDIEFNLTSDDPRPRQTQESDVQPLGKKSASRKTAEFTPVPPGSYNSAAIILLTDGQTTTGPDPVEASAMAAERGVRVFTVGIGTPDGQVVIGDGWSMHVKLDEEPLKKIAATTHAQYFYAGSTPDLLKVYRTLNSRLTLETRETEIGAVFSAVGAALALLAALLSMLWFNRVL